MSQYLLRASEIALDVNCPGCDVPLTLANVGGYRTYCAKCVDVMPRLPGGVDSQGYAKGYRLEGRYPDFRWVEAKPC